MFADVPSAELPFAGSCTCPHWNSQCKWCTPESVERRRRGLLAYHKLLKRDGSLPIWDMWPEGYTVKITDEGETHYVDVRYIPNTAPVPLQTKDPREWTLVGSKTNQRMLERYVDSMEWEFDM